jgi:hypothetical protein
MKGWRTLGLSVALAVIGTLNAFDWADIIPDKIEAFIIPLMAIVFGYLRTITNTALGQK